ncbi:MAG TPA: PepSY domain-containing protein [Acetobacteraceae bacterium]|nr:PepSY domain-containing protein [Acetobacteraceae bacterium]
MYRLIVMCTALTGLMAGGAMAGPAAGYENAEIAGVQAAAVAPEMAIQAAEGKLRGRAVSFGLEKTATVNAYEVTIASNGTLQTVQVDPTTGAVIGVIPAGPDSLAADGLPANAVGRAIQEPVSLATAVRNAQNEGHGRALEAGYAVRHGQMAIDVDVIRDGATHTLTVDSRSGQVAQATPDQTEQHENHADNDADQTGGPDAD